MTRQKAGHCQTNVWLRSPLSEAANECFGNFKKITSNELL